MTTPADYAIRLGLGMLPVLVFLGVLVLLDSYKLLRLRQIVATIGVGCAVAAASFAINSLGFRLLGDRVFSQFGAPVVEESLKALYLVFLIRASRVGFMVDAAIQGFAVGAGFALLENLYYAHTVNDPNLFIWVLRGFGTAVMHGGTTALFGILSRSLADRRPEWGARIFLPGLLIGLAVHISYNASPLPPLLSTVVLMLALPLLMVFIFSRSENSLQNWLNEGFDSDVEMLAAILAGQVGATRAGAYLTAMKRSFEPEIVADMLCLLRISLELAVRAKADLLKREAGFAVTVDAEVKSRFDELRYLEKSIGRTGRMAIAPLIANSSRDVWQLHMLAYE